MSRSLAVSRILRVQQIARVCGVFMVATWIPRVRKACATRWSLHQKQALLNQVFRIDHRIDIGV